MKRLSGKGQDVADDCLTGFDSAGARTDQCDFAKEVGIVGNSIGGAADTVQGARGVEFERFNGTLSPASDSVVLLGPD